MTYLIGAYRTVLIDGRAPDLTALAVIVLASALLLGLNYQLFRRASRSFVEEF
jgi:lipopolysaccharide transport system permease protein